VGCMYKVLTMVLANRLRAVITIVVSDSQSAFVKGKQILDGILVANEVVDEACQLKKKKCSCSKWISKRPTTRWTCIICISLC